MSESASGQSSKTLWAGRYESEPVAALRKLNDSLSFDQRMYVQDIRGSQEWARALARAGILTERESEQIVSGLIQVLAEFTAGTFAYADGDEDIHTAVERRLTEKIGPVAGKLHTGRSRNDQVATDLRLWTAENCVSLSQSLDRLISALLSQAEQHIETLMPGYTHLRTAQPITAAYWLLSYVRMLIRDLDRFTQVRRSAIRDLPLGSAALAGTAYAIDRTLLGESLGFRSDESTTYNGMDSVSDRDFVAECLFAASLLMIHLSRFAEDMIMYSSPQFGFVELDERYTTGSSIMPQKQNPDILELARGKTGRVVGHLTGLLTTLKGLPSAYDKDLQEDKEPLFDTIDTLMALLPALTGLVETLTFDPSAMRVALGEELLATDVADYLVRKGVPFREAHGIVGRLVRRSNETHLPLSKLPFTDYQLLSSYFGPDVYNLFDFAASIAKREALGGTGPNAVRFQIEQLKQHLSRISSDTNP